MTHPSLGTAQRDPMQDPIRPAKQRKHLMTPGQVRPQPARSMSLTSVQRWVMSTLVVSTGLHLAVGLVLAAHYVDERSSKIGLLVIAALLGLLTMAGGLLVHRARVVHPLLVVGVLPALVGAWWVLS